MKSNYIAQAWLVLALAACFGGALAGVQVALSDRIDANKKAETRAQVPELVPGAASAGEARRVGELLAYPALDAAGRTVGWVVRARGQGFADVIELLIGFDADAARVTGMYVLDQKETPGLGNKISDRDWRAQFAGKSAQTPFEIVKRAPRKPAEVEAVTGATISSDSVAAIVNKTMREFRNKIQ